MTSSTKANALPRRRIEAAALTIARGPRILAEDLTFAVEPGELLLVRGPNGAGKTSLLACLAGTLRPAAGKITIAGGGEDEAAGTHVLGHLSAVKPRLTVAENLQFWADMLGGDRGLVAPTLDAVGLAHAADLEAGYLSAGQTRRLAIGRLLVADRPVWLLDEPTAALDSEGRALIVRLIDAHLRRGGLAVAATHEDLPVPAPALVRTLTLGHAP